MLRNFKNILNINPITFCENVYLCNPRGEILSHRQRVDRKIKNIFRLLERNDARQVIDGISTQGRRSLLLTDSSEGVIVFDLSFALRYGLIVAIIPQFSRNEMLEICKGRLMSIMDMTDDIRSDAFSSLLTPITDEATNFAERLIAMRSVSEELREPFVSNSMSISKLMAIARTISSFYGCTIEIIPKDIRENIETESEFSHSTYAFALSLLTLLARTYSADRGATLLLRLDETGFYFDISFKIAEQYQGLVLSELAPSLKHLIKVMDERANGCVFAQRENVFIFRGFPWNKLPDSKDLKKKRNQFLYE